MTIVVADLFTTAAVVIGTLIGVVTFTAGIVAAFLGLKGETRESIESSADKRVEEARQQVVQMATVSREWRENFEGLEKVRIQEADKHAAEIRDVRDQLDKTRSELAVAMAATDLSGLEERMNSRFDAFLEAQQQQTNVLADLAKVVQSMHERLSTQIAA